MSLSKIIIRSLCIISLFGSTVVSADWTIGKDFTSGAGITPDKKMTIVSPNGGEFFQPGQLVNVTWQLYGFGYAEPVTLTLARREGPTSYTDVLTIAANATGGQTSFAIPFTVKPGNLYVIKGYVNSTTNNFVVGDVSNNTFTIGGTPVSPVFTTTQASPSVISGGVHIAPNTNNVLLGSFTIKNQSTTESVAISSLRIALVTPNSSPLRNASKRPKRTATVPSLGNFSNLKAIRGSTSEVLGYSIYKPQAVNTLPVNMVLSPLGTEVVTLYISNGAEQRGSFNVTLLPIGTGVSSRATAVVVPISGTLMVIN